MSHTTTLDVRITDQAAFAQAARDLGYEVETNTTVKLYQSNARFEDALSIQIPGWNYPVAVTKDGQIHFDNYNGAWGNPEQLDKLRHKYARDLAVRDAKKRGYRVREQQLADGSTELILER